MIKNGQKITKINKKDYKRQLTPLNWLIKNFFETRLLEGLDLRKWCDELKESLFLKPEEGVINEFQASQIYWELMPIWHKIKIAALHYNMDILLKPEVCLNDPVIKKKLSQKPEIPTVDPFGHSESFSSPEMNFQKLHGELDTNKNIYSTVSSIRSAHHGSAITNNYDRYFSIVSKTPDIILLNGNLKSDDWKKKYDICYQARVSFLRIINNVKLRCIRRCPKCFDFYFSGDSGQLTCGKDPIKNCSNRFGSTKAYRIQKNIYGIADLLPKKD